MAKRIPYQNTLVMVGVFGAIGLAAAYLYSQFQSGAIAGSVPGMPPELQELAMAAESELAPAVGDDPMYYNHIPIQILGPAEPLDFTRMNFTGSYQHSNCSDPIRTYF